MPKRELVSVTVRLRKDQMTRLTFLQATLAEKMKKEMTFSELLEKVIDDFLETK